MSMRSFIDERPMLGWGVAAIVALVAVLMFVRGMGGGETAELTQEITIRCRETGKEWKLARGAVEKQLMMRPFPVNPDEGLINPDTGKPTGFPVDDWKQTVTRINASRETLVKKAQAGAPPADSSKP